MKCRLAALALAALSSSPAFATASAGISTSNFTVTLKDLNTNDTVTPGVTWDQSWSMWAYSSYTAQTGYTVSHAAWGDSLLATYAPTSSSSTSGNAPSSSLTGALANGTGSYGVNTTAGAAPMLSLQQSIEDGARVSSTSQWQRGFWLTAGSQASFSTAVDQYVSGSAYTGTWSPAGTNSYPGHIWASTYLSMSVLNVTTSGGLTGGNQFTYNTDAFDSVGEGDQFKLTIRNTGTTDKYYTLNFYVSTNLEANLDPAVAAVPEPGTYALMALGLVAVGAAARRRTA